MQDVATWRLSPSMTGECLKIDCIMAIINHHDWSSSSWMIIIMTDHHHDWSSTWLIIIYDDYELIFIAFSNHHHRYQWSSLLVVNGHRFWSSVIVFGCWGVFPLKWVKKNFFDSTTPRIEPLSSVEVNKSNNDICIIPFLAWWWRGRTSWELQLKRYELSYIPDLMVGWAYVPSSMHSTYM